jgi:enamine deaminase RidA (YjgF/YER057c/UK114 family)
MRIEDRLKELDIAMDDAPVPVGNFMTCCSTGSLVYISGQGPVKNNTPVFVGKVGREVSREHAYEAARLCGLNLIAQLKIAIGNLDRVKQIVSVRGVVASADNFYEQPSVINGCSDLLVEIFGDRGRHSRCALGVNVLPQNIPVEIEMLVEVD